VRRWYNRLLEQGIGRPTVARAYILLKAIFATAVDDGLIRRNPCRIKGASSQHSPERPLITVPQVYALADCVETRYRPLILLAAFCSLRWGELAGLQRRDVDIAMLTVTIDRSLYRLSAGGHAYGPPKSAASRRVVIIPDLIIDQVAEHVATAVGPAPTDLIFTSPEGAPMHHGNFRKRVWLPAVNQAGLTGTHLHDLRHAGNVMVADAGANLRELMERMGHSTTRAALVYLHGGNERQRQLAASVSENARAALLRPAPSKPGVIESGTALARPESRTVQRAAENGGASR